MWLNVGCGTHRAPDPWWNIDTIRLVGGHIPAAERIDPDEIVDPGKPLPYDDGSCERVFLSHVLEHIPWEGVPDFLRDVRRVASGKIMLVGPDTYRTIEAYRAGTEPWHIVEAVLEHKAYPDDMAEWPGALHHWNCHEARVLEVLARTGWDATPIDDAELDGWPVVGWNRRWQFAITAR